MTTSIFRESAKIYQFPVRRRNPVDVHREESKTATDLQSLRVSGDAVGSGWYHDAAIQESKRLHEH
jgi:hypothetical protein